MLEAEVKKTSEISHLNGVKWWNELPFTTKAMSEDSAHLNRPEVLRRHLQLSLFLCACVVYKVNVIICPCSLQLTHSSPL